MKNKQFLFLMTLTGTLAFCGALQADGAVDTQETPPNRMDGDINSAARSNAFQDQEGNWIYPRPDGSYTINKRDGTVIEVRRDGSKLIKKNDGSTQEIKPGQ